ncbi:Alkaline phosphatase [Treponema brennaborense DSM 12168]|uniref:Alkaline phosphatase n=2 Tax=Treponema TaxID=157 RepID=F4LKI0_TREBD|nr:Alkaline phosphatase [Treponema brennaborense DSM 12168]
MPVLYGKVTAAWLELRLVLQEVYCMNAIMTKVLTRVRRVCAAGMVCAAIGGVPLFAGGSPEKNVSSINTDSTGNAARRGAAASDKKFVASPKYVFLFIGDGMSYPQIQSAAYFLGKDAAGPVSQVQKSSDSADSPRAEALNFMQFPTAGSAQTYDATSFAPDSASTATSILTGHKTHSGSINVDITKKIKYTTIAEQLKAQKNWKIGVVSSVNLNHATPAAMYAHQASRKSNYAIGEELVASGFDYFAGGALMEAQDKKKDKTSIYDLAKNAGYEVVFTQKEAESLTGGAGRKALVIGETLADADSLSYENDRAPNEWALRDYVRKGVEFLENDTGFFMMVEGGKIDWACHANDAGSTIADTVALADAVAEAIAFYQAHPEDTLILVTGDHETGGLSIGFAGTDYDTWLDNLENQKISYAKYDKEYVSAYKAAKTPFETVLADVEKLFGLVSPAKAAAAGNSRLVLTDYETDRLRAAYGKTMNGGADTKNQAEYVLYGSYEPLTVTVTHVLNNKSGVNFASYAHTGIPVPVFAEGAGNEVFGGYYDNTDIYRKLAALTGVAEK